MYIHTCKNVTACIQHKCYFWFGPLDPSHTYAEISMNLTVFIMKHSWVYWYPRKTFAVNLTLHLHSVTCTSHQVWCLLSRCSRCRLCSRCSMSIQLRCSTWKEATLSIPMEQCKFIRGSRLHSPTQRRGMHFLTPAHPKLFPCFHSKFFFLTRVWLLNLNWRFEPCLCLLKICAHFPL